MSDLLMFLGSHLTALKRGEFFCRDLLALRCSLGEYFLLYPLL